MKRPRNLAHLTAQKKEGVSENRHTLLPPLIGLTRENDF